MPRYENELKTLDQDSDRLQALIKEYLGIYQKMEKVLEENGASELYGDLMGYIMQILDYLLKSQKKARKEMNNMGGKILESFSEKERKKGKKELSAAIKDIASGMKSADLKKKYSAETIKEAKNTLKIVKSIA